MRFQFQNVRKDKVVRVSTGIAIILLVIFAGSVVFVHPKLPPLIPLINNVPWGVERLVDKNFLFVLPGIALLIMLINVMVASMLYEKNILLARILSFNTLLFNTLALLALAQIISLVL